MLAFRQHNFSFSLSLARYDFGKLVPCAGKDRVVFVVEAGQQQKLSLLEYSLAYAVMKKILDSLLTFPFSPSAHAPSLKGGISQHPPPTATPKSKVTNANVPPTHQ